ncbi:E3 ubiquitin-protein ligase RNF128-like [Salarias fasciatus]|uniref:E3 ubiquitin-protein ligase RNF128-like n=1 Tax=Salarias fasciatus TaxID=181472 RepID=A0A672H5F3_SALFA|nr:E3 ubiquitin-protein ligase RNF128-like [Salarias fasciatus]
MGEKRLYLPFLLCLSGLVHSSAAVLYWSAVVETDYVKNNETVSKICECGVFGRNSPVVRASGVVTLPTGDPRGCGLDAVYSRNSSFPAWIALVKRGNCTFSDKINAAKRQGAAGVVVYNVDGSENSTSHMAHSEADGIVAIMIGNLQGTEIYTLVRNGTEVKMVVDVGSPHGPWMDTHWLYILSIAFFVVTAASIAYFGFITAKRLFRMNRERRQEQRLKSEAKKAIARLPLRTLKRSDEETSSDTHMCAVCIESYKEGDVVTVLTCNHIFHKDCIEPWLLDKRTCPMCKCDIMSSLGIEEQPKESLPTESPQEVTVVTVTGGDALYEVPLTDPSSYNPERQQHHYDSRAFQGDSEAARG